MNAIHSLWTRPLKQMPEKYMLYTMVLSALKWRQKNGKIKLVTDRCGMAWIDESGVRNAWDEISDELEDIPDEINSDVFWAAGKIFALKLQKAPIVALDTDFIVWNKIDFSKYGNGLCAIHDEKADSGIYPNVYTRFFGGFSWDTKPVNAAFYYVGSDWFIEEYTNYAERFMLACTDFDRLCPMVFAEQRLFSATAKKLGINLDTISSEKRLFSDANRDFTHLWGYKAYLEKNPKEKEIMENKLLKRIKTDFPNFKIQ